MAQFHSIATLMSVPATGHNLTWLKNAVQAAVKLELSTIPPYLCACWSVKAPSDPVAHSIRDIVLEEMLHLGLACNLLASLGDVPQLNTAEAVPTYPGPLPGGVQPNLQVSLQGLTPQAVKLFMQIEYPQSGPIALAMPTGETFASIGEFYDAILQAFETLSPVLSQARQLEGPLGLWKMITPEDVRRAVELIQHQGEGSQDSPKSGMGSELAHYYRFKEIDTGHKLRPNSQTGHWEFTGDPVPFPAAWPMAAVPQGGYQQAAVTSEVWTLLDQFDTSYTELLGQLQLAWQNGSDDALSEAVDTMYQLRGPAVALMKIPIPTSAQTYGPCFRLKQSATPPSGAVFGMATTIKSPKSIRRTSRACRPRPGFKLSGSEDALDTRGSGRDDPREQVLELAAEIVRQGRRNVELQAQMLELVQDAMTSSSSGGTSSIAALSALAGDTTAPVPPALAAANRRLIYVHGICQHAPGYSNPWWQSLKPFVGDEFGLGTLGQTRLEVVWSDLVNQAMAALAAAPSDALSEQLQVAEEIRHTLEDRLDRHAFAVAPQTDTGAAAMSDALGLVSIPGLNCVDDFTVYLVNDGVRQEIINRFIQVMQPLLSSSLEIDIVSHSWGTVVAYEGLRQLESKLPGKVRNFFTVGAALSIGTVQRDLRPENRDGRRPGMVHRWTNLNAHGDVVGGRLQGRPYEVDDDFPNLEPFGCGSLLGLVNPVCAHSSYFQDGNVATNRDIFAAFMNHV